MFRKNNALDIYTFNLYFIKKYQLVDVKNYYIKRNMIVLKHFMYKKYERYLTLFY